ncbi:MAG: hypothetical protein O7E57_18000 [Gammaproteobacteria bacterium]|nr:hypothetical protein [Gammaproteobacteria bacterium]
MKLSISKSSAWSPMTIVGVEEKTLWFCSTVMMSLNLVTDQ